MTMEYQKFPMHQLCEITSSKRIFASDYQSDGVPFYRGREITEKYKGNLEVSTELFIDRSKFEEIKAKFGVPKEGDLLLTSVGTLGSVYRVEAKDEFYFKDGNLTWFRNFKGINSRFLYYWLISPQGKAELSKCTIGSSQSAFTIVLLKQMEIELPPLATQHKIADILSAYDDLIENNQRRIAISEDMARNLYREWFVHFRFPGHEQAAFRETELGLVPEGWEVKRFSDTANFVNGFAFAPHHWSNTGKPIVKIAELKNGIMSKTPYYSGNDIPEKYHIKNGSVLFSWSADLDVYIWPHGDGILNQHLFDVQPLPAFSKYFLFFSLKDRMQIFRNLSQGTTTKHIKRSALDQVLVIIPPMVLRLKFDAHVESIILQVINLTTKNTNLRRTRDLLLPRLVSGEIDVAGLEIVGVAELV